MQDITMASGVPPVVQRSTDFKRVTLVFQGTRAEHIQDRGLRIAVMMPVQRALELRELLRTMVPQSGPGDWREEVLGVLEEHRGETGNVEGAFEVVQRLSQFWREHH